MVTMVETILESEIYYISLIDITIGVLESDLLGGSAIQLACLRC